MAEKNQNMNQSKNRAEEHDESVLNPEIKNESDLAASGFGIYADCIFQQD